MKVRILKTAPWFGELKNIFDLQKIEFSTISVNPLNTLKILWQRSNSSSLPIVGIGYPNGRTQIHSSTTSFSFSITPFNRNPEKAKISCSRDFLWIIASGHILICLCKETDEKDEFKLCSWNPEKKRWFFQTFSFSFFWQNFSQNLPADLDSWLDLKNY